MVDMLTVSMFKDDTLPVEHRLNVEREVRDRIERIRYGANYASSTFRWFNTELRKLDKYLRLRFHWGQIDTEPAHWYYAIDRFDPIGHLWNYLMPTAAYRDGELGERINVETLRATLETLWEGDMQRWATPAAYLAYKRQKSAAIRLRNEREGVEKVAAVVDTMSKKQLENFVAVEAARHTGEKINVGGGDQKFMEMVQANTIKQRQLAVQKRGKRG